VKPNQLRYVLEESLTTMNRRRGANLVSTVIMGLSLLILGVFLLVTINVSAVIGKASEELRVYVYLKDGVDRPTQKEIQFRLLALNGIDDVQFVSRDEALVSFRRSLGRNADMLDALDGNPLPNAFRVKVKPEDVRTGFLEQMARQVEAWPGVEEVRYGQQWLERGEKLVKGFYVTDLVIGIIIFLSVIFVIANTVRLTVVTRQKTIEIAKLVGATDSYIQIPFLIEGALQGAVASLLAVGLLAATFAFARRYLPGILFLEPAGIAVFVAFCAFLGAVGSLGAMRRFLKI
jgi:cell division transport system permease protein